MSMWNLSSRRAVAPGLGRGVRAAARRGARKLRPGAEGLEDRSLLSSVGLDPTWGFGGASMLNVPADNPTNSFSQNYTAIALQKLPGQSEGQVIEAGTLTTTPQTSGGGTPTSTTQLIVSRLTTNGFLDPTFGSGGTATPVLPAQINGSTYTLGSVADVRVDSNGRIDILTTANLKNSGGTTVGSDFLVVRLTSNGALDSSFGASGVTSISFGAAGSPGAFATPSKLALGPLGGTALDKIDIVGTTSVTPPATGTNVNPVFAVAQLSPNGLPDTRWSPNGTVTIPVNPFGTAATQVKDQAGAVVVQVDGNVVVGGSATNNTTVGGNTSNPSDIVVMRLNGNNGALDTTFNGTGMQVFNQGFNGAFSTDSVSELALSGPTTAPQSIVIVGTSNQIFAMPPSAVFTPSASVLTVTRLTPNGAFDTTFNGSGKFNLPLAQSGVAFNTTGSAVLVGSDGSLLVGGTASEQNAFSGGPFTGVLLRLNSNGTRDTNYGTNGVALLPYSVDGRMLMQSDGKVIFYSGDVVRTTPPAPAAATTGLVTNGAAKNPKISGVTIQFNTNVNPGILTNPNLYQIRLVRRNGRPGKTFKLKKRGGVSYNATTRTLTLTLNGKVAMNKNFNGFQVMIATGGIVGADGQILPNTPIIIPPTATTTTA